MTDDFNRHTIEQSTYLSRLPARDRELVKRYAQDQGKKHGKPLSWGRVTNLVFHLSIIRDLSSVAFEEITDEDIDGIWSRVHEKGYSANTTRDIIAVLKSFLRWMVKKKLASPALTLDAITEIKIPPPVPRKIRPEDLLTQEEIEAIIKAASPRDRAIITLMTDAALRPIEAGTIRYSDLEFSDNTMFVHVKKKTDRIRRIPAPNAMHYVMEWINNAPYPIEGDDLLFRSRRFNRKTGQFTTMKDDALRWSIAHAAARAGVKRYKHPYQFRHGAITRWMDAGISTAKVAQLSHGGPSRMVEAVYWHPDQVKAGDEVLAKVHGRREKAEKVKANPTSRVCPTCGRIYPLSVRFCTTCGPLTEEAKISQSANIKKLLEIFAGMTPEEIKEVQETIKHR